MALSRNTHGALFMALAMAGFTCGDAMVKAVRGDLNVGQIMMVRGIMTTIMVFFIARHFGALRPLKKALHPMLVLRILFEALAAVTYITALGLMPLANSAAILQFLPLAVTLGAALFLAEPVGWRRWSAIIVGFIGVLVIIRPGPEGFTTASVYVIASMFAAAARDLATKRVRADVPSLMVTLITAASIAVAGGVLMVSTGGFQPMSVPVFAHVAAASVFVLIGYQFIILSMRTGEISFIAPFRYIGLLWAILLGFIMFGELPDAFMVAGMLIVVASGLYTFYRENKRRVAQPLAQEAAGEPPV